MEFYSVKLLATSPYRPGQVIYEKGGPIDEYITLYADGVYRVTAVSGGAGGIKSDGGRDQFSDTQWAHHYYYSGATGAYYDGELRITRGTHHIVIGGGGYSARNVPSGNGGSTAFGGYLGMVGGQGVGNGSTFYWGGAGGYFQQGTPTTEVQRYAAINGYNALYHGEGKDWYASFGVQYGPSANYGLGNYGYGGASTHNTDMPNGAPGYFRLIYTGRL